jgi:tetratricopeptide (TPR) repeat protein
MRRLWIFIALSVASVFWSANASRAFADDEQICVNARGDEAIEACTRVISSGNNSFWAYNNRGNEWKNRGDLDRAIADYNDALRLAPKNALIYLNRGLAWESKGEHDRAIADYNDALKLDPKFAPTYNNRGNALGKKGEYDKAIADYNDALKLDPKNALAYNNRGHAWEQKGEYDKAIADFNDAIRLDPNFEGAKNNLRIALEEKARQRPEVTTQSAPQQQLATVQPQQQAPVATTPSGKRVALVIGNAKYSYAPLLANPTRDAQLLASTLRKVGFQSVTVKTDLTREGMIQALREFATTADGAEWAMVYYSGHGMEFGGANYLIPVDAQLKADRDIDLETVNIGQVLNTIEGAKRLRLVILDACRDNPFASQMRRTMASRSVGRGLARIEPEAGTLVVYAAKHGETALDGDGNDSPFVQAMVKRMVQTPPLEIRRLFDYVRDDVLASTHRKQQPFSYGSLSASEDFYFVR